MFKTAAQPTVAPSTRSWMNCLGKKTTSLNTQFMVVINDALTFGGHVLQCASRLQCPSSLPHQSNPGLAHWAPSHTGDGVNSSFSFLRAPSTETKFLRGTNLNLQNSHGNMDHRVLVWELLCISNYMTLHRHHTHTHTTQCTAQCNDWAP